AREESEDRSNGLLCVHRTGVAERLRDCADEILAGSNAARHMPGFELIVIDSANEQRQLSAEMRREIDRQPVAKLVQHRREHLPREMLVATDVITDVVEPYVGGFQRPVEYVEAACAHGRLLQVDSWPSPARTPRLERAFRRHSPLR